MDDVGIVRAEEFAKTNKAAAGTEEQPRVEVYMAAPPLAAPNAISAVVLARQHLFA